MVTVVVTGPQTPPVIAGVSYNAAGMHIIIQTLPCYTYALECKDNLLAPTWNTCQTATGTGVGLAVVRKIIERHGGTITVEDAVPKGAAFVIHLPIAAPIATGA